MADAAEGVHLLAVWTADAEAPAAAVRRALDGVGVGIDALNPNGLALVAWSEAHPARPVRQADVVIGARRDATAAASGDDLAGWVATTLPPAGRALVRSDGASIAVATDGRGLAELYTSDGPDFAIVASSAAVLADAIQADVDDDAVLRYSALGHFLGDETPWRSITRLAPGEIVELGAGGMTSSVVAPSSATTDGLASAVAAVVEDAGAWCRPSIELSGGLDSRLILAAVDRTRIELDHAFTIGPPTSPDRVVAAQLADRMGLAQRTFDPTEVRGEAAALRALVLDAGVDRGWMANPLDAAVLHRAEMARGDVAGFSGQNGEIARGFYYRGPHALPVVRGSRIDLLTSWRLMANEAVDAGALATEVAQGRTELVAAGVGPWLDDGSVSALLRSTDAFYLRHRMTRWVGPAYAGAARRHPVIAPFFSAGFIESAGRLTIGDRRHSRSVADAVRELSAALAGIELAGGRAPEAMAAARAPGLHEAGAFGRKAARKIRQRVRPAPGAAVGTDVVGAALSERRRELRDLLGDDPLLASGLGDTAPSGRTLGFMVSLAVWRSRGDASEVAAALA